LLTQTTAQPMTRSVHQLNNVYESLVVNRLICNITQTLMYACAFELNDDDDDDDDDAWGTAELREINNAMFPRDIDMMIVISHYRHK